MDSCGSCHTLGAAGTTGTVGPSLDGTSLDAVAIESIVRDGSGGMPSFSGQLSDAEIAAVAEFVAGAGYPPIADIVRAGCRKPGSPTWCFSSLRQTALRMIVSSSSSLAPVAEGLAQVGLVEREEAGAQLAVGGQADAVAVGSRKARRRGR